MEYALKTWTGEEQIAKSLAREAMAVICEAYERNPAFLGNKSKKWIVGGLFYLLGQTCGHARTQKQIARVLSTTEVTIRASQQSWLTNFPEFWTRRPTSNVKVCQRKTSSASRHSHS
ncbi:MAG TPA: hypothetical protein VK487_02560 [Candidatus Bathyarchaeia archaeon]|nr:hypothetical protein [Candidatus Bathyarchaeia archaeon]